MLAPTGRAVGYATCAALAALAALTQLRRSSVSGAAPAVTGWAPAECFSSVGYGPVYAPPIRDWLLVVEDTLVPWTALTGCTTREELCLRR